MDAIVDANADNEWDCRDGHETEVMPHQQQYAESCDDPEYDWDQYDQRNAEVPKTEVNNQQNSSRGPHQCSPAVMKHLRLQVAIHLVERKLHEPAKLVAPGLDDTLRNDLDGIGIGTIKRDRGDITAVPGLANAVAE